MRAGDAPRKNTLRSPKRALPWLSPGVGCVVRRRVGWGMGMWRSVWWQMRCGMWCLGRGIRCVVGCIPGCGVGRAVLWGVLG